MLSEIYGFKNRAFDPFFGWASKKFIFFRKNDSILSENMV